MSEYIYNAVIDKSSGVVNVLVKNVSQDNKTEAVSNHRYTIAPGDNYSKEPAEVQNVCAEAHTQEVIDAYIASTTPDPLTAEEQREIDRKAAQARRDTALNSMTHTFADGSVVQVRPRDLPNFQTAIAVGTDQKWILANNTTRLTTIAELQEAMNSGVAQVQAIWGAYALELEAL